MKNHTMMIYKGMIILNKQNFNVGDKIVVNGLLLSNNGGIIKYVIIIKQKLK